MAEMPLNKEENMLDPFEGGTSKAWKEEELAMVELRKNRRSALDYRQFHRTGSKTSIDRDTNVVSINLDHGYCAKPSLVVEKPNIPLAQGILTEFCPKAQNDVLNNSVDIEMAQSMMAETTTLPESQNLSWNLGPESQNMFSTNLEPGAQWISKPKAQTDLFTNRVGRREMESLLGMTLADWEKDPEVAQRIESLGEVLGLAQDLNISVDGLNIEAAQTDLKAQSLDLRPKPPDSVQNKHCSMHDSNPKAQQQRDLMLQHGNHPQSLLQTGQKESSLLTKGEANLAQTSQSQMSTYSVQSHIDMPIIDVDFASFDDAKSNIKNTHKLSANQLMSQTVYSKTMIFGTELGRKNQGVKRAGKTQSSRKANKRGRKPSKIDVKAKLERSRQSARECRARKKLRYQYLEELVSSRERAVFQLRDELEQFKKWAADIDDGNIPPGLEDYLERERQRKERSTSECSVSSYVIRSRRRLTTDRTESESSVSGVSVVSAQSPSG